MFVIVSTALITIFSFVYLYINRKSNSIPGPWNLPIIGSLHRLNPKKPDYGLSKLSQKYGPIFRIKLGLVDTVVISEAQLMRKLLIKNETLGRPSLYLFKRVFRAEGIVYSMHQQWKNQRKLVTTFLKTMVASKVSPNKKVIENLINKSVEDFIHNLESREDSITIDPSKELNKAIFSLMTTVFLGKMFVQNEKRLKNLSDNLEKTLKIMTTNVFLNFLPFLRFLPNFQKNVSFLDKTINNIREILKQVILEKNILKDNSPLSLIDAYFAHNCKNSLDQTIAIKDLQALLVDMLTAGTETNSFTLCWAMLYLASYEEVQQKVRQELNDVLHGKTPEVEDLLKLPYTEATIAEIYRIRTIAPLGGPHYALDDIIIDNFKIPKNTMILGLLWNIHMNPDLWPEPEQFRPERFLDSSGKFYQPNFFLPFQTGKRMCVGADLAKIVTFLYLTNILQNFKIKSFPTHLPDLKGTCGFALTPKPQKLVFVKI